MIPRTVQPVKSKYFVITFDYLLPLFITLIVILGGWLVMFSPIFQVASIECQLDYQPCGNPSILAELNKSLGKNIFRLNTASLVAKLTSGDFTIRTAVISRLLPTTLVVNLQSIYPTVAVQLVASSQEWIVLDNRYRVIGKRDADPNVPTVLVDSLPTLHVGQVIDDPQFLSVFALARSLTDELPNVKTIKLSGETIKLTFADGKLALLTTAKDQLTQIRTLQAIFTDSTIISGVGTIDVRFVQPVLR